MLSVALVPKHGNASSGHFPHTGHLGVTPVHIAGSCVTKIEEGGEPVPTRSISIRVQCCEQRLGGPFSSQPERVLWEKTKTLWSSESPNSYEPIGFSERPFRLSIPPDAAMAAVNGGLGAGSQVMREWRVVWKLEAIIEYKPIAFVGHRATKAYTIDLHDHRVPSLPPSSPPSELIAGSGSGSVEFLLIQPQAAYGPGDSIDFELGVRPLDSGATIRRVSFILERKLELYDDKSSTQSSTATREPSPSTSPGDNHPPSTSSSSNNSSISSPPPSFNNASCPQPKSRISAIFSRGLSPRPSYARLPDSTSPPPDTSSSGSSGSGECKRQFSARLAESSCDAPSPGPDGFAWPSARILLPKRGGRWDIGHSVRTRLASVTFEIRVKVLLRVKGHKAAREIAGPIIPISIVGTTSIERSTAAAAASALKKASSSIESTVALPLAKNVEGEMVDVTSASLTTIFAKGEGELVPKARRRHRSSRRGLYMHEGTVDISDPVVSGGLPTHVRPRKTTKSTCLLSISSDSPASGDNQPSSPAKLTPIAPGNGGGIEDPRLKSILLPATHATQTKPVHFIFPSPPPHGDEHVRPAEKEGQDLIQDDEFPRPTQQPSSRQSDNISLPPIQSILPYPTPSNSTSSLSPESVEAIDYDSLSILRQFQQTGRRISTTTSEEEEVQPSRSRQRLSMAEPPTFQHAFFYGSRPALGSGPCHPPSFAALGSQNQSHPSPLSPPSTAEGMKGNSGSSSRSRPSTSAVDGMVGTTNRPALPSLDALGLGLPQIEDARPLSRRRPRTAPSFGVYSGPSSGTSSSSSSEPQAPRPLGGIGRVSSSASIMPIPEYSGTRTPRPLTSIASLPRDEKVHSVSGAQGTSQQMIPRQPPSTDSPDHQPFAFAVHAPDDPTPVSTPIISQR